jgi:predicted HicB family RNase H-like nuclease
MLVNMKQLTPSEALVTVSARLPLPLRNKLVNQATRRNISLNQLLRELLEQAVSE